MRVCSVAQLCLTLCDSMDCSPPGFPRQEYWSGFPFPSLGDLPGPGIEPMFPALVGRFCTAELSGKPFTFPPCYQSFLESPSYKLLAVQSSSQDLLLEEAKLRKTLQSMLEACPPGILKQGPSKVFRHGQDDFCWAVNE